MSAGPASYSFVSQRLKLNYIDWGNPDAPTLVLVHGGRDHCRNWDWIAERFKKDWHIVAPDLRGHGDSEWPSDGNYLIQNYIYDLWRLVSVAKLAPFALLGHSLGGRIVLRYAGIFPEQVTKLIGLEGFGPGPQTMARRENRTLADKMRLWTDEQDELMKHAPLRYPSFEAAHQRMKEANPTWPTEHARRLTEHSVKENGDGTFSWKFDNAVRVFPPYDMAATEVEDLWARIECPTLLVNGDKSWSPNAGADGKVKFFKNARAVTIKNASHWMHHDQLDATCDLLAEFLKA
jgi:pimeloyl-ACP methyl ester carboxylesterase